MEDDDGIFDPKQPACVVLLLGRSRPTQGYVITVAKELLLAGCFGPKMPSSSSMVKQRWSSYGERDASVTFLLLICVSTTVRA